MIKLLLTVFLILSLGSMTSCGNRNQGPPEKPRGQRTPPRAPSPSLHSPEISEIVDSSEKDPDFVLPVILENDAEYRLILNNVRGDEKGYKLSISAKPKRTINIRKPPFITVEAAFDGVVSYQATEKTYIITLSSSSTDLIFYFELHKNKNHTTLHAKSGDTIEKGNLLAKSRKHPIIFYVKKNGELHPFCFSLEHTSDSESGITIKNNFKNKHPDC